MQALWFQLAGPAAVIVGSIVAEHALSIADVAESAQLVGVQRGLVSVTVGVLAPDVREGVRAAHFARGALHYARSQVARVGPAACCSGTKYG